MTCLNSQSLANLENSAESYWGPLSKRTISGILCRAKTDLRVPIVSNKGDKTKRTVLINKYENGGLKMVDLSSFNKSLKTTWIRKYLDTTNHGKWKEIVFLELEKHGGSLIFKSNLNKTDSLKTFSVQNNFTKELL